MAGRGVEAALAGRTIAITGGGGAIGRALSRWLIARGAAVRVLDARPAPGGAPGEWVTGSVLDAAAIARAIAGSDAVVHLAAQTVAAGCARDAGACAALNVYGTALVGEACARAGTRHLIFASTAYVYGSPAVPVSEQAPVKPESLYAATKAAAELLLLAPDLELPVSILRFANVYGPGVSVESLVGGLVHEWRQTGALTFRTGKPVRDFLCVDDAAETIGRVVEAGAPAGGGEVLNAGTGVGTAVADAVRALQDAIEAAGHARPAARERDPGAPHGAHALVLDVAALQARLGWRPAIMIHEGFGRLLAAEGMSAR